MFGVRECLGCLGKLGIWKGTDKAKKLDTVSKDLEGGNQDWDFESWDSKPAATPPPIIQTLDDFDGLAPKAPETAEAETDYFGSLQTAYVPPVQGEGSPPACSQSRRARTVLVSHHFLGETIAWYPPQEPHDPCFLVQSSSSSLISSLLHSHVTFVQSRRR